MMNNDERMLLIELIDEFRGGIFEPFFDDLGEDRRSVKVEMYVHPTKHTPLKSAHDATDLLKSLGAPVRLLNHHKLVGEAGVEIVIKLNELGVRVERNFVDVGIAVHDAGKILHPKEHEEGGSLHEAAGEQLLIDNGVLTEIARCCRSHAQYDQMIVSLEELVIALAHTIWKGARNSELELMVMDAAAERINVDRWHLFEKLDTDFEQIASGGGQRLFRSK